MNKILIFISILLLIIPIGLAATIKGEVYDFSLKKLTNIIIEINTAPAQRMISNDGSYSFNVPKGDYIITAKTSQKEIITSENITINEEGIYTLDLISFIDLEEEDLTNETDPDISKDLDNLDKTNYIWLILGILLIVCGILIYYKKIYKKSKTKYEENIEESDLKNKILEVLKKEQRISQKELRKLFPYSEAKISLVLTELEAKGKIEKIKKGRTNVIILKN